MAAGLIARALVRNDAGLVLAVAPHRRPGRLTLPGGFVDPGESVAEAAARELHEETGLVAESMEPLLVVETARRHTVFFAVAARGRLRGSPEGRPVWVEPAKLLGTNRYAASHRAVFDAAGMRPNPGRVRGYKVMALAGDRLVSGANARLSFPAREGAVLRMPGNGIYLSPNRDYVLDYYSGLAEDEVLLTLGFRTADIKWGNLSDRESEVGVSPVTVISIERIDPG